MPTPNKGPKHKIARPSSAQKLVATIIKEIHACPQAREALERMLNGREFGSLSDIELGKILLTCHGIVLSVKSKKK